MRTTLLLVALTLFAGVLSAQRPRQPRQPAAPAGGAAGPAAPPKPVFDAKDGMPGARFASLSPDGKTVVFAMHGDIWSMPFGGGRATRLTLNQAYDSKPLITRDGKNVVFVSDRSGSYDVWVMPIDGGQPRRLTWHSGVDVPTGFTTDGKQVLFQSTVTNEWEIWRVPLAGGTPVQLTTTGGRDASTLDDGSTLFYVDGASDIKVQEYSGSANDRLYRQVKGKTPEHLAAFDGNSREPRICKDGGHFFFTREVKGSFELFRYAVATGEVKQLTELGDDGMSGFDVSADEKTVVFVWKFFLHSLDLSVEGAKPKLMPITVREDSAGPKIIERTFSSGAETTDISADGRFICFELGGNLWLMTADGGQARMLTTGAARDQMPRFSPDSRTIAFFSNRTATGEVAETSDIWLVALDGSNLRQLTNDPANDFFQNWSPDGKAIVHCSERSGNRDIWLTPLDGGQPLQLTNSPGSDDDPSFSPDGRTIAFDSNRENPNNTDLWLMSADGGNQRRVYGTPQIEECPVFSPDGKMLVFNRIVRGAAGVDTSVVVTDINGSGEVRVADGHYGKFTPSGQEIFYLSDRGEMFFARAPLAINTGRKLMYMASTREPAKETMLRAFDEAFMSYGVGFYDPNFHGKDWGELGRKYRALVETAQCQEELLFYLNRMVGELSASHSGAFPGGDDDGGIRYLTGGIGMRLEPEAFREGRARLKVVDVEKGGPADRAWIRKGDYIFRIGNQTVGMKEDAYALFENTVGREISLYVADNPNGENFREVKMMPEHPGQKAQRDYLLFVQKCKAFAAQNSAGAVAYIHIPAMMPQALQNFINELASPQVQAARALVIDVRDNGGGNIHQQLIDILSRKKYAEIRLRDGRKASQAELYWDRPFVVMINERSYSDAEVFPHAIKTLKMGKIVGVPTPGAVIGTRDMVLSDGTRWRIPGSGFFNIDGTNQEHNGCQPDYLVEITPADKLSGKDPQLDKAVKVLLDQLRGNAEQPTTAPTTSPDVKPKKTGDFSAGQSTEQGERFAIKPKDE
ncbi:MAG: PD40 domain-containing protein [Planctomycetes bacterium]|nr:PD40 domain-containing protein [Planctomycetota bacterium]